MLPLEVWHLLNGGNGWSHPLHVHFKEGQILKRDGLPPPKWERWARKDMYRVGSMPDSGDSVEVALRFREFFGTHVPSGDAPCDLRFRRGSAPTRRITNRKERS